MTIASVISTAPAGTLSPRPRWQGWLTRGLFAAAAGAVLSAPWWGPQTLSRLEYFRVHRVEFDGVRFVNTSDLMAQLALDSTASIWNDLDRYAQRVARHPLVQTVEVTRILPGTVVVSITERVPIALVPDNGALSPVDATGHVLPIDIAQRNIDVPVVASRDTAMLRFLDGLRSDAPRFYDRVVEMRRVNAREFWLQLKGVAVRTRDDVTVERLQDILRVEESLAQQNQHVVELDLRFQDQVIARTP